MADKPMCRILVTHRNPHFDELIAIVLLQSRAFGKRRWSWLNDQPPKVYFVDETEVAELARQDGVVLVGIGGGLFDEHKANGRLKGVCACDLVARHLGIADMPELREILDEVRRADTEPGQKPFELAELIKVAYSYGGSTPEQTLEIVRGFFRAKYMREVEFFQTCPKEFEAKGRMVEISGLQVAFVESDLQSMSRFCRFKFKADLVIVKKTTGHTSIFSSARSSQAKAAIPWIARSLLAAEALKLGLDQDKLAAAVGELEALIMASRGASLPGAEHWYWHAVEAGCLLNGSTTHGESRPTPLTLVDLERVVREAVTAMTV